MDTKYMNFLSTKKNEFSQFYCGPKVSQTQNVGTTGPELTQNHPDYTWIEGD